jgi:DNA-binding NarL/FixJ family response regulator
MTSRPGDELSLAPDELILLRAVASGLSIEAVARRVGISPRTVRRRLREVCDRLQVGSTIEAVAWAARRRLI